MPYYVLMPEAINRSSDALVSSRPLRSIMSCTNDENAEKVSTESIVVRSVQISLDQSVSSVVGSDASCQMAVETTLMTMFTRSVRQPLSIPLISLA